jgi:hypothetical protein
LNRREIALVVLVVGLENGAGWYSGILVIPLFLGFLGLSFTFIVAIYTAVEVAIVVEGLLFSRWLEGRFYRRALERAAATIR